MNGDSSSGNVGNGAAAVVATRERSQTEAVGLTRNNTLVEGVRVRVYTKVAHLNILPVLGVK